MVKKAQGVTWGVENLENKYKTVSSSPSNAPKYPILTSITWLKETDTTKWQEKIYEWCIAKGKVRNKITILISDLIGT
jgi:hypothetical protein